MSSTEARCRPLVLVTSFEPFGGSAVNPTIRIAELLRAMSVGHGSREYLVLPVVGGTDAGSAWSRCMPVLDLLQPDAVVALGENAHADRVHFERLAVNLRDSRIADNSGVQVIDLPVVPNAPDARFATLPLRTMLSACIAVETPAALSLTAGTFLCNELMYRLLDRAANQGVFDGSIHGFLHVPQLPEQAALRGGPSMALEVAARGVHAAIEALAASILSTPRGDVPQHGISA